MFVKNDSGRDQFIDFSKIAQLRRDNDRRGFSIPANADNLFVPDHVAASPAFQKLLDDGDLVNQGFGRTFNSPVMQGEFSQISEGLFVASFFDEPFANVVNPLTASELISATANFFDLSKGLYLNLGIDQKGGDFAQKKQFLLAKGFYNTTQLVDLLNNHEWFPLYAVASVETVGPDDFLKVASKSLGSNSLISVLPLEGISDTLDANLVLQLPTASVAGTGTASVVKVKAVGPTNQPLYGAKLTIGIYDAATAGSLVGTAALQNPTQGIIESGLYTNEVVAITDQTGTIEIELVDTAVGTVHVEAAKDPNFQFAVEPAARSAVSIT